MIWRRYHPEIGPGDPRYRQVSMLYVTVLVMALYAGVIGALNLLVLDSPLLAAFDFLGCALALAIYAYVRRSGNFRAGNWAAVLALVAILASFTLLARGSSYSLLWVTVLPPIAFFLLGLRAGSWVTGLFFVVLLGYLAYAGRDWQLGHFGLGALLNCIEVLTVQWFIFRHYEKSRAEAYQQLRHSASLDPMTGLWNRARIDELLTDTLSLVQRVARPVAVILLDIDHFKRINDQHGHLVGDAVLAQLGELLRDSVRQTDRVGRWGGEEFLVICPDTEMIGARTVAEKIREAIAGACFTHNLRVSASLGVAAARNTIPAQSLVRAADRQLYRAKAQGRNQVCAELEWVD